MGYKFVLLYGRNHRVAKNELSAVQPLLLSSIPIHFYLEALQRAKKQLYLFQFLLECSFPGCILQATLATGLLPEKMNVECQASVEKQPDVLN